jgi:CBS domain-containing protein
MKVQDTMTTDVCVALSGQPISAAAELMAKLDCGVLPVGDNDRLVGMITDRDIAVRAVANGMGPDTPVREVMSAEVCYCFADQDLDEVCANMADQKIRRLPVIDRDKRLVGIVSLGDIARADGHNRGTAQALSGICAPGGHHSQAARA